MCSRSKRHAELMKEKIRVMQHFFDLKESGLLDQKTVNVMKKARCGDIYLMWRTKAFILDGTNGRATPSLTGLAQLPLTGFMDLQCYLPNFFKKMDYTSSLSWFFNRF